MPFGQGNGYFKYTVGSKSILPERRWAVGTDVGAISLQMTGSPCNGQAHKVKLQKERVWGCSDIYGSGKWGATSKGAASEAIDPEKFDVL